MFLALKRHVFARFCVSHHSNAVFSKYWFSWVCSLRAAFFSNAISNCCQILHIHCWIVDLERYRELFFDFYFLNVKTTHFSIFFPKMHRNVKTMASNTKTAQFIKNRLYTALDILKTDLYANLNKFKQSVTEKSCAQDYPLKSNMAAVAMATVTLARFF